MTSSDILRPLSERARFVLSRQDDGWVLIYIDGDGLARVIAQNASGDPMGAHLEWLAQCAAERHHVPCERQQ